MFIKRAPEVEVVARTNGKCAERDAGKYVGEDTENPMRWLVRRKTCYYEDLCSAAQFVAFAGRADPR